MSDTTDRNGTQELGDQPVFRFLTDHNVPDSVGNVLKELGQDVVRLREAMPIDSADPVVAQAAIQDERILVSWDRDFRQQRFKSPRFERLSRLCMSGFEIEGAMRLNSIFDIVEFALIRAKGRPITIRVDTNRVTIEV